MNTKWEEQLAGDVTDIIFNREAGWSKKLEDRITKAKKEIADQRLTIYKAELITEIEKLRGRKHNVYNMDNKVANDTANYVWEEALDSVLDIIKKKQ